MPVVEKLVEQLQQADILHLDETHWYKLGKLHWLWVAVTTKTALSVIETCRLRQVNPWNYIAEVLGLARKGISPPTFPADT